MRFSLVLIALSGVVASASAMSTRAGIFKRQFPTCADSCLANADFGDCNESDDSCLCRNSAFVNSVTSCIQTSCTGSDIATADEDAQQLCLAVGVTLSASSASATATSPSSTSATSATSASASSGAAKTGAAMTHGVSAIAGLVAVGAVAFAL
ncbi:hypothetical protein POSPLADRAFT_1041416 [Postia placenta MAD-698-R-SB12]|uniref:CFEM domain-containing protein n=1 Tax=Postia placenta MAD-698-R-SB12 TaxID=670580 RepID=A0A1X6MQ56_9APHY|nr:hypothetical protein POSPLADRAFT_1041416 [Postia placenta MAD-698-R-SB12]OSX58336.1 hypothetical protein POSPLADRAFT_1041416 [Postia placenta MAD-698-R-SB12]